MNTYVYVQSALSINYIVLLIASLSYLSNCLVAHLAAIIGEEWLLSLFLVQNLSIMWTPLCHCLSMCPISLASAVSGSLHLGGGPDSVYCCCSDLLWGARPGQRARRGLQDLHEGGPSICAQPLQQDQEQLTLFCVARYTYIHTHIHIL